jgi:hypothetical protein
VSGGSHEVAGPRKRRKQKRRRRTKRRSLHWACNTALARGRGKDHAHAPLQSTSLAGHTPRWNHQRYCKAHQRIETDQTGLQPKRKAAGHFHPAFVVVVVVVVAAAAAGRIHPAAVAAAGKTDLAVCQIGVPARDTPQACTREQDGQRQEQANTV